MKLWPPVRPRPPIIQSSFRGVNRLDAFSIGDDYATFANNLTSAKYPALTTRPGYSFLGAAIGTGALGLGVWKNQELHAVFNDGTWRKWTGSAWQTLASGLNTTAHWTFTNFQGNLTDINLIGSNGVDAIKRYDGTTVSNLATAPAGGNYITQYADRLWCSVGNTLHASAYRMADDWTAVNGDDADSFFAEVETPTGEKINGIHAGLTKLTISKASSLHELFGYAPSEYSVRSASPGVGITNNFSAAALDGILYFREGKGIYQYSGGPYPSKDFSLLVQEYSDRVNLSVKDLSCAGANGKYVYMSLPLDNSTMPDTMFEYDIILKTWNLWQGFTAMHFAKMGDDIYIGDSVGRVLKLGGATDNGFPITWRWESKYFSARSLSQKAMWTRLWITLDLPTGSTITVSLNADGGPWIEVGKVTAASDIQHKAISIQSAATGNARYIQLKLEGSGPCTVYEIARDQVDSPIV